MCRSSWSNVQGRKVGSFGDVGCFSFFGKQSNHDWRRRYGTTNNQKLDEQMRILRDHGMSKIKRYWHDVIGYNYRMTNLQAAIGLAQLERIEDIHKNRREYENSYKSLLPAGKFTFQNNLENRRRITWLVCVLLDETVNRENYIKRLKEKVLMGDHFFTRSVI